MKARPIIASLFMIGLFYVFLFWLWQLGRINALGIALISLFGFILIAAIYLIARPIDDDD